MRNKKKGRLKKWTTHFKRCIDDITLRTQEEQRTAIEEEEKRRTTTTIYYIIAVEYSSKFVQFILLFRTARDI